MTDLEEKVIKRIFRKNTNTGLYTHCSSYVPWTHRTAWIKSLTSRVSHICLPNKLSSEINFFKKLASWTGFPIFFIKRIINQVLNTTGESTNNAESPDVLTIYIWMSYNSDKGLLLLKSCMRKIRSNCIKTRFIRFKTHYGVNKIEFYCNTKDKTAVLINLFVVYIFYVLVVVPIILTKQKEHMKGQLLHWCSTFVWYCVFAFVTFYVISTYSKLTNLI